jgi:RNA polymerase sigma-70 factor (ECF subfamily)
MSQTEQMVAAAIRREPQAVRALVGSLTPVIQVRVARALLRRAPSGGARGIRQEVEDMTQEVFLSLFDDDARALRAWDPARGLSLANFVGLIAQHQVASVMRNGRRRPWAEQLWADETPPEPDPTPSPEDRVASREMLLALLERLRAALSPRGLWLCEMLLVEQASIERVCEVTGMTPGAVYTFKSRLARLVRGLVAELQSPREMSELTADRRTPEEETCEP